MCSWGQGCGNWPLMRDPSKHLRTLLRGQILYSIDHAKSALTKRIGIAEHGHPKKGYFRGDALYLLINRFSSIVVLQPFRKTYFQTNGGMGGRWSWWMRPFKCFRSSRLERYRSTWKVYSYILNGHFRNHSIDWQRSAACVVLCKKLWPHPSHSAFPSLISTSPCYGNQLVPQWCWLSLGVRMIQSTKIWNSQLGRGLVGKETVLNVAWIWSRGAYPTSGGGLRIIPRLTGIFEMNVGNWSGFGKINTTKTEAKLLSGEVTTILPVLLLMQVPPPQQWPFIQ